MMYDRLIVSLLLYTYYRPVRLQNKKQKCPATGCRAANINSKGLGSASLKISEKAVNIGNFFLEGTFLAVQFIHLNHSGLCLPIIQMKESSCHNKGKLLFFDGIFVLHREHCSLLFDDPAWAILCVLDL